MSDKKFEDLMKDQEFVKELINQKTEEDAKKMFVSRGVDITDKELIAVGTLIETMLQKAKNVLNEKIELTDEEIKAAVGGSASEKAGKLIGGTIGALTVGGIITRFTLPAGVLVGGATGAAIGTIGGETGVVVGGAAGGLVGGTAGAVAGIGSGAWAGAKLGEKIVKWLNK